jgi:hypothetical protein
MSFAVATLSLLKWGSATVYYLDFCVFAYLLLALLLNGLAEKSVWISTLILLGLLAFDYYYNDHISRAKYSIAEERQHRMHYMEIKHLRSQLTRGLHEGEILCLVKDMTNQLYPYCLFSTFEAEFPGFLFCDDRHLVSSPRQIFNYPASEICKRTRMFIIKDLCIDARDFLGLHCLKNAPLEQEPGIAIYRKAIE